MQAHGNILELSRRKCGMHVDPDSWNVSATNIFSGNSAFLSARLSIAVFSIPKTAHPEKKDRPEGGPLLD
jgi:hypothetical protein